MLFLSCFLFSVLHLIVFFSSQFHVTCPQSRTAFSCVWDISILRVLYFKSCSVLLLPFTDITTLYQPLCYTFFLLFCLMKMHAYNSSALVLFILIIYWHPIVFTFVRLINISSCTSNVILLIYLQFPLISYFSVWTKANHLTGLKVDENGLNVQNILMAWFVCDSKQIYVWPTHIMYSNKVSWLFTDFSSVHMQIN